jgi:putative Ca2+/H+ antiporter (TMEM165/GDT1 family)
VRSQQITTADLAARGNPLAVFTGSVMALWLIAALAVTLGGKSLDLTPADRATDHRLPEV